MNCGLTYGNVIVLTKQEETYGEAPVSDYNVVTANTGADFKLEGADNERTVMRPGTFSPTGKVAGIRNCTSSIKVEMIGGGVDSGTGLVKTPQYNDLMVASAQVLTQGYYLTTNVGTGTFLPKETISATATKAQHVGTANLASGHDWSGTSESFSINVNGAGVQTLTLSTECTSVGDVVTALNSALSGAGITTAEAYASTNNVGIRTTTTGLTKTITLAAGTPNALTTLGWTAGTYTGTDAVSGTVINTLVRDTTRYLYVASTSAINVGASLTTTSGGSAVVATKTDAWYYLPTSKCADMASLTMRFNRDGLLMVGTGMRSDVSYTIDVGKVAEIDFSLTGKYHDPTNDPLPSVSPTSDPLPFSAMGGNIIVGDLDPEKLVCSKIDFKAGAEVSKRNNLANPEGMDGVAITGRKCTGSIDPLATASLTDFNPFDLWKAGTKQWIEAGFGTDRGNRYKLVVPYAQLDKPEVADKDKQVGYTINFTATGLYGDDEYFVMYY